MDSLPPIKLLDQVRQALRIKHYAYRTEESYMQWIRRYILFHNKRHPKAMAEPQSCICIGRGWTIRSMQSAQNCG
jgi:hypothetical protein